MKNKKTVLALILVCVIGLVGGTIAYFSSTDIFENLFNSSVYKMEVYEVFESPVGWLPGDTTPKNVVATNKGNVDAAVRVSFQEVWKDGNGNTISLTDSNGKKASIINFGEDFYINWQKSNENGTDYYYYISKLGSNESTSSVIESVTFNPDINGDNDHNCVTDDETHTTTCSSDMGGYSGGQYKLTIKVETVQYDKYREIWNTNVNILKSFEKNLASFVNSLVGSDQVANDDPDHNVRYIGPNPNNYVLFNNELWRIIGTFDGRVKLLRSVGLNSRFSWDEGHDGINSNYGVNEWTESTLMQELNGDYLNYNLTEDPMWHYYRGYQQAFDRNQALKQDAQDLIDDAVWYLGAADYCIGYWDSNYIAPTIYHNERSGVNTGCQYSYDEETGQYIYEPADYTDGIERKSSWTGKVGLMYPSDYLYATSGSNDYSREQCLASVANNGVWGNDSETVPCGWNQWVYHYQGSSREYTISPGSNKNTSGFYITRLNSGGLSNYDAASDHVVRPSVYLKADVKLVGGLGTSERPFLLSL